MGRWSPLGVGALIAATALIATACSSARAAPAHTTAPAPATTAAAAPPHRSAPAVLETRAGSASAADTARLTQAFTADRQAPVCTQRCVLAGSSLRQRPSRRMQRA
jgi:hypothetical protein